MTAYLMFIRNRETGRERYCLLTTTDSISVRGMPHNGEWFLSSEGIQAKFYTLQQAYTRITTYHEVVWSREVTSSEH